MSPTRTVPCGLCGTPTPMTGTKRCDRCWELEHRIQADPEIAREILLRLNPNNDMNRAVSHLIEKARHSAIEPMFGDEERNLHKARVHLNLLIQSQIAQAHKEGYAEGHDAGYAAARRGEYE